MLEDTEKDTPVLEMTVIVEEEEEEDIGREASVLEITMAEEEEEDMREEGMLAMGTNEKFAQRPLVMGGLL